MYSMPVLQFKCYLKTTGERRRAASRHRRDQDRYRTLISVCFGSICRVDAQALLRLLSLDYSLVSMCFYGFDILNVL